MSIVTRKPGARCATKLGSPPHDQVEHRLRIAGQSRHRLQNVRDCPLVLDAFPELRFTAGQRRRLRHLGISERGLPTQCCRERRLLLVALGRQFRNCLSQVRDKCPGAIIAAPFS